MIKETFIALMKCEEWDLTVTDWSQSDCDGPMPDFTDLLEFKRSSFSIFIKEDDIENLKEDNFKLFFKKHTKGFHFYDDWKKCFKGSEFLIPVVEEELKIRENMLSNTILTKLTLIQSGYRTLEETIEYYEEVCNKK